MRRWVKAIFISVLIAATAIFIFLEPFMAYMQAAISYVTTNPGLPVVLLIMAVVIVSLYFLFGQKVGLKHKLWSIKDVLREKNLHSVDKNVQACHDFMKPSGIHEGSLAAGEGGLSLKAVMADSHDADVPLSVIMLSTEPRTQQKRQPVELHADLKRHFFVVDRRTNEVSYNPDVSTMKEALEFKKAIRLDSTPLEKKKGTLQRMSENIMEGYYKQAGAGAAPIDASLKKKEGVENDI